MISAPTFIIIHAPQLKTHVVYSIFGIRELIKAGYNDEEVEALNMTKLARKYFNKHKDQKRIDWMFKMTGSTSRDELLNNRVGWRLGAKN